MLILITGLPGSGKTYFAKALAKSLKATHLNSDGVRREMGKRGQYDDKTKQEVYNGLKLRTAAALREEHLVIVDATFYKKQHRVDFISIALQMNHSFAIIEIKASEAIIKDRVNKPRPDSEADFAVYKKIKKEYQPLEYPHLSLWSDQQSLKAMIQRAKTYLGR